MTDHLAVDGGTLAYEVTGSGPLVVLAHGMGDTRAAYRGVVPGLVAAGYRVAALDLRGCGESSVDFTAWSRTAIAGDLIALIRHLGGPAVVVGHSIAGGAATIAAATEPTLVTAVVELAPFTRDASIALGDLRVRRVRQGAWRLLRAAGLGSVTAWRRYLEIATPGTRPADWTERLDGISAMLREPGRMRALKKMGTGSAKDAGGKLADVTCPVLVVMGDLDPDWADPRGEGTKILDALPGGVGRLEVVAGAGHYPHDQFPGQVTDLVVGFLRAEAVGA